MRVYFQIMVAALALAVSAGLAGVRSPGAPLVRQATGVVDGVTIHAVSDEFSGGWDLRAVHVVDGSGLSGEPLVHAQIVYPGGHSWQTADGTGAATITFDLQAPYELRQVHVWNLNFYSPYNGRGAREVNILTSLDGTDWTAEGMVVLSMATGFDGDPGLDLEATAWSVARYVRFDILNNYGGWDNAGCVGLSEVRFLGGPPASSPLQPTWTWVSGGGGNGVFRVKLDDPDLSTEAILVTALSWTPDAALSAGGHTLYVQEQDEAGNWSPAGSAVALVPDQEPPTITGLSDDGEPAQSKVWTWGAAGGEASFRHLIGTDPDGVPRGDYAAVATAAQEGGDGIYYLHVQARDEAGNESAVVTVQALLDNTAPVLTGLLDDPAAGLAKTWTWGATDADSILVYRYLVDQAADGIPATAYGPETAVTKGGVAGVWYLHVQARDRAGNESAVATVSALLGRTLPHQADQNGDWSIQLAPELTRLIQFYNLSGYHGEAGTEDGYAPGPGATTGLPHQADQNGDWSIQLSPELTRLIQFYNSGGYHCEAGTEDGYAPDLIAGTDAPRAGMLASTRQITPAPDAAPGALEVLITLAPAAPAALTSLLVAETLPAGWAFLGVSSHPAPELVPAVGATGPLGFAWIKLPPVWPVKLTYRVAAAPGAADATGPVGHVSFRASGSEMAVVTVVAGGVAAGQDGFYLGGTHATAVAGTPLAFSNGAEHLLAVADHAMGGPAALAPARDRTVRGASGTTVLHGAVSSWLRFPGKGYGQAVGW